jgi:hypothetical protein
MKTIGIYNYDEKTYTNLAERLKEEDILLKPLENGMVDNTIDLYIFDIDNEQDIDNIKLDRPFAIVSSITGPKYIIKSGKLGALDFISRPFIDLEVTAKRIQRLIVGNEHNSTQNSLFQNPKNYKLIDIEIKRADRGKYPLTLAAVTFESRLNRETLIRVIDKIKTVLRESDSCIPFSEQNIMIVLPFADKPGSVIVSKKITDVLASVGYKAGCICLTYPDDGDSREKLFNKFTQTQSCS